MSLKLTKKKEPTDEEVREFVHFYLPFPDDPNFSSVKNLFPEAVWKCAVCRGFMPYSSPAELFNHLHENHGRNFPEDKIAHFCVWPSLDEAGIEIRCGYVHADAWMVRRHIREKHFKVKKECEYCGCKITPSDLAKHVRTSHGSLEPQFQCDVKDCCQKEFKSASGLLYHQSKRDFPCFDCQYMGKTRGMVRGHIMDKHFKNGFGPRCGLDDCVAQFNEKSKLVDHIVSYHGRRKCEECDHWFVTVRSAKEHHKHCHSDTSSFSNISKCGYSGCSFQASSRGEAFQHEEQKHRVLWLALGQHENVKKRKREPATKTRRVRRKQTKATKGEESVEGTFEK